MGKLSYNPLLGRAIGPATKLDSDGNPYPSFSRVPGSAQPFPEGTLYYPDEYPDGVSGSMQFVWDRGKWMWRWGDWYKLFIGKSRIWRSASGVQISYEKRFVLDVFLDSLTLYGDAEFGLNFFDTNYSVHAPYITGSDSEEPWQYAQDAAAVSTLNAAPVGIGKYTTSGIRIATRPIEGTAGSYVAGERMYVSLTVTGRWKA